MHFNSIIPCAEDPRGDLLQHSFARRVEDLFQAIWAETPTLPVIEACELLGDYEEVRIGVLRRAAACNAPDVFMAKVMSVLFPTTRRSSSEKRAEWEGINDAKLDYLAATQRKLKALQGGSSPADIGLHLPPDAGQPVVRVHALDPAFFPQRETAGASGFDLRAYLPDATETALHEERGDWPCIRIGAYETKLVSTGLMMAIPVGYEMQIRPRSGISAKGLFSITNAPGSIDADFRGCALVIVRALRDITIFHGDRIAQGVIAPIAIPRMISVSSPQELGETGRGEGGFGSTGLA